MGFLAFLSSIGWFMNLLGFIGSCLPYGAFSVTNDWAKDFDCFGIISLVLDIISAFLKAWLYILIGGLSEKTCPVIIEAVSCNGMAGCVAGGILYKFFGHKNEHGLIPEIMRVSISLFVGFIFAVGLFMIGLQVKWNFGEGPPLIIMVAMIITQFFQALYPISERLLNPRFSSDESAVVAWKCLATVILILTSSYDAWSLGNSLHPFVTPRCALCHLVMCLSGAATGVVQLIMRLISVADRLFEGLLGMCRFWSRIKRCIKASAEFIAWYVDATMEWLKGCFVCIISVFSSVFQKLKAVFGPREP